MRCKKEKKKDLDILHNCFFFNYSFIVCALVRMNVAVLVVNHLSGSALIVIMVVGVQDLLSEFVQHFCRVVWSSVFNNVNTTVVGVVLFILCFHCRRRLHFSLSGDIYHVDLSPSTKPPNKENFSVI
jgi:hypothetical protein